MRRKTGALYFVLISAAGDRFVQETTPVTSGSYVSGGPSCLMKGHACAWHCTAHHLLTSEKVTPGSAAHFNDGTLKLTVFAGICVRKLVLSDRATLHCTSLHSTLLSWRSCKISS